MSADEPTAAERERRPRPEAGGKSVDDILRALLVGDVKVKVDPLTGRVIEDPGAPEEHP